MRAVAVNVCDSKGGVPGHSARPVCEHAEWGGLYNGQNPSSFNTCKQLTTFCIKTGHADRVKIVKMLWNCGLTMWAINHAVCGVAHRHVVLCADCGNHRFIHFSCNLRFCGKCGRRAGVRIAAKYTPALRKLCRNGTRYPLRLITLTVKNWPKLTADNYEAFLASKRRFMRTKLVRALIKSALIRIEITNKGKGWHPHFHILCSGRYFDQRKLEVAWSAACRQDKSMVDVRAVRNVKSALREITKYISKGFSFETEGQAVDLAVFLKGRRTFLNYNLVAEATEYNATCSKCGGHHWFHVWSFGFDEAILNAIEHKPPNLLDWIT